MPAAWVSISPPLDASRFLQPKLRKRLGQRIRAGSLGCLAQSRMLRAIVGGKLFGALRMVISPHFIHCFTDGRARRVKDPSAFRATWSLSILLFRPYQSTGRSSLSLMEHAALTSGQENGMSKSNRSSAWTSKMIERLLKALPLRTGSGTPGSGALGSCADAT